MNFFVTQKILAGVFDEVLAILAPPVFCTTLFDAPDFPRATLSPTCPSDLQFSDLSGTQRVLPLAALPDALEASLKKKLNKKKVDLGVKSAGIKNRSHLLFSEFVFVVRKCEASLAEKIKSEKASSAKTQEPAVVVSPAPPREDDLDILELALSQPLLPAFLSALGLEDHSPFLVNLGYQVTSDLTYLNLSPDRMSWDVKLVHRRKLLHVASALQDRQPPHLLTQASPSPSLMRCEFMCVHSHTSHACQ